MIPSEDWLEDYPWYAPRHIKTVDMLGNSYDVLDLDNDGSQWEDDGEDEEETDEGDY